MVNGYGVYFLECVFYGGVGELNFSLEVFHRGGVCGASCSGCNDYQGVDFPATPEDVVD